jgi:hypothetical protein
LKFCLVMSNRRLIGNQSFSRCRIAILLEHSVGARREVNVTCNGDVVK